MQLTLVNPPADTPALDGVPEETVLTGLGNAYIKAGRYAEATEIHQRCLALRRSVGDAAGAARTCVNIGHAYERLARYDLALDYMREAVATFRRFGDHPNPAVAIGPRQVRTTRAHRAPTGRGTTPGHGCDGRQLSVACRDGARSRRALRLRSGQSDVTVTLNP